MAESRIDQIGRVTGFFAHPSVAVIELSAPLKVGDQLYIKGHTTDLHQAVESLQIDQRPVQEAGAGQTVGLNVKTRCRRHDLVYKFIP